MAAIQNLLEASSLFPIPSGLSFSYGTAGFRSDASVLSSTVFRSAVVAALRSLATDATVGLMITASHNPVGDNGVKIADPDGGMMTQRWEPFADRVANAPDPHSLVQLIVQFAEEEDIPLEGTKSCEVLLGRDTRPSGEALLEAAKKGISAVAGVVALDMGIVTTPQLHWMVRSRNKGLKASEFDYFSQIANSFRCLVDLVPEELLKNKVEGRLIVDGANGVGGAKLEELKVMLTGLEIEIRNVGRDGGVLNEGVGADYVQKEKVAPSGFGSADVGTRCASLDGDADRLVYFRVLSPSSNTIDLVDGDKILSLFAVFIKEQLSILNKKENKDITSGLPARLGIVQTAYANGASTDYLKQLGLEVVFTPTGVKYLHKKASEYDIGIYFEANGHGTVLFSEDFISRLEAKEKELASSCAGSKCHNAALRLLAVTRLINQAVGDALSGLLLVEAVLQYFGWSIQRWSELYQHLPSRQLKIRAMDFHSLSRRELQSLYKRNGIPANTTNAAMAHALADLLSAQPQEDRQHLSPKKADATPPPKTTTTGRRTSARLSSRHAATAPPLGSPLPRSRRVAPRQPPADVVVGSISTRRSTRGKAAATTKMADSTTSKDEQEQEQQEEENDVVAENVTTSSGPATEGGEEENVEEATEENSKKDQNGTEEEEVANVDNSKKDQNGTEEEEEGRKETIETVVDGEESDDKHGVDGEAEKKKMEANKDEPRPDFDCTVGLTKAELDGATVRRLTATYIAIFGPDSNLAKWEDN